MSVVPINAEMRSAELIYLIAHSEIGLAVTLPERAADLRAAAAQAGVVFETMGPDDAIPAARTAAPHADKAVGIDTECGLLYTSGTTGRPKGCILSNAYFLRAGEWYAALDGACSIRPDAERVITPLPLNHMNAMAFSTMVVLVAGGCLVQLDRFHPKTWLASARESGATIVHYLGVMPAMLLSAPASPADRDHAIRWGFGAGVDRKNHAPFEERFGFPLVEAWAMTETGAAACIMANREPRLVGTSCFGRQEDFVQIRLVGEDGSDVGVDAPGELLVRSAGVDPRRYFFSGYLKDEEATREAWADGWFHTGDLVRRDAEGNFFFVDRKKNVIRRSGENISAVEVESVLNEHPAVKTSAVAATPDAVRGDEVLACIVMREGADASERAAIAASIVDACARAARLLQGAGLRGIRRCAAAHTLAEDPARPAARDGPVPAGAEPLRRHPRHEEEAGMTHRKRLSYEGVAVAVPVTVPYVRYSTRTAHWFIGQAIEALVESSGVPKSRSTACASAASRSRPTRPWASPSTLASRHAGSTMCQPAAPRA